MPQTQSAALSIFSSSNAWSLAGQLYVFNASLLRHLNAKNMAALVIITGISLEETASILQHAEKCLRGQCARVSSPLRMSLEDDGTAGKSTLDRKQENINIYDFFFLGF